MVISNHVLRFKEFPLKMKEMLHMQTLWWYIISQEGQGNSIRTCLIFIPPWYNWNIVESGVKHLKSWPPTLPPNFHWGSPEQSSITNMIINKLSETV